MTDEEVLASLNPDEDQVMRMPEYDSASDPGAVSVPGNPAAAFDESPISPAVANIMAPGSVPADPTDALAQGLPPAQTGIPTEYPSQQFAPQVPREAPGMVPQAPPLNGAPSQAGGVAPGAETGTIEQALAERGQARDESDAAKLAAFKGQQQVAAVDADKAEARRQELERRQQEDATNAKLDQAANDKAAASLAQTDAAIRGFKFKDLWADKSGAQKAASALGAALLAIGAGMMKTPKYAIQILDEEMAQDHQKQLDHLNLLKEDYARAGANAQMVDKAMAKRHADVNLARARKDDLIAAQFTEVAARAKDANSANEATAFAAKLNEDSKNAKFEALTTLGKLHRQDELDKLNEEYKRSQIDNQKSLAAMHWRTKTKGSGAGGGGRGDAWAKFQIAATDGKTPDADLGRLASAAGFKTNQIQKAILDARTEAANEKKRNAQANNAGLGGERLLSKEVNDWQTKAGIGKIAQTQRELGAVSNQMQNAPHNPLQQALALEKAVSAARGGAATQAVLGLALKHLGGKWDSVASFIQAGKDGQLGEKQLENFRDYIRNQLGTAQLEGKEAYDNYNKWVESQPEEKRQQLVNERGRVFSSLHGFGGKANAEGGGNAAPGAPIGTEKAGPDGRMRRKTANGWELVQ